MQQHICYIKFALRFADMKIPELVTVFNAQVQNRCWSIMRAYHDQTYLDDFLRRDIDTSAVYDGRAIFFAHSVRYDMTGNRFKAIGRTSSPIQNSALGSLLFANGGVYYILEKNKCNIAILLILYAFIRQMAVIAIIPVFRGDDSFYFCYMTRAI